LVFCIHPIKDAILNLYNQVHDIEKTAVKDDSGWIAITSLQVAPDFVFNLRGYLKLST
jgi:hypothetical protein